MPQILQQDADAWAIRINASWRRSFESTIEAGQLLIDAKRQLPHGQFEKMIEAQLDFSASTAQRLMIIARDHRLTNPAHGQLLPRSARTLYELSKLTDEQFSYGVEHKIITPDMERKDVELIRPTPHRGAAEHAEGVEQAARDNSAGPTRLLSSGAIPGPGTSSDGGSAADGVRASDDGTSTAHHEARGSTPAVPASEAQMPSGGLAIAHQRVEPRDGLDFFPTPLWATRALFEHVFKHLERLAHCKFQRAWEPACGEGHMAEPLNEYFREVWASDIKEYGYSNDENCDFLKAATLEKFDWIITNPPFNTSTEFVLKALELAGTGVAMFVRLTWLESVGRYEKIFRDHPPTLLAIFSERVPLHKGRWEDEGTTMTAYIWLVWIKGAEPRAPFWIPPGCRERLTRPEDIKRFGKSAQGEAA